MIPARQEIRRFRLGIFEIQGVQYFVVAIFALIVGVDLKPTYAWPKD
jgi:hypothetical protein